MLPALAWRRPIHMRLPSVPSLVREPLVQFLALGAALFLLVQWRGAEAGPGSRRITITTGQVEALSAGFARTWRRPPTAAELKGLVDEFVREEMAYREAVAMGLDRDDAIIRRRLRQKLEFLIEDMATSVPVTDEDLRTWLAEHPAQFRTDPVVSFLQVYVSPDRRGAAAEADARALMAELEAAGSEVDPAAFGDRIMLPSGLDSAPPFEVARVFGADFADTVFALAPGRWHGPVVSGFGLHLVYVLDRSDGTLPDLDGVRPLVEREILNARRIAQLDAMYDRLLERYAVTVNLADSTQ